jgi:outer membrane protein assembly factor BamE (lipoprotein component of BamABCDE complex)
MNNRWDYMLGFLSGAYRQEKQAELLVSAYIAQIGKVKSTNVYTKTKSVA